MVGILGLFALACGGSGPDHRAEREVAVDLGGSHGEERERVPDPRELDGDATFTDLLRAARTLDDRRDQQSDAGCLLRWPSGTHGWRLEADLAVAVRPLRDAPDDLDEILSADGSAVNVLSRWGAHGPGGSERLTLSAVTTTLPLPRSEAWVWAVTERGVYVRSTEHAAAQSEPIPVGALSADSHLPSEAGALFVTAEGGVPLSRLADVLGRVPDRFAGRVALAVALDPGTRLPASFERGLREPNVDVRCPDGLPVLAEDAPLGVLPPEVLVASLGPLRQGAETCAGTTGGPGAAGGRVTLALRIGPGGEVQSACIFEDETGDPMLASCLTTAARATAFPAPDPAGIVDVHLPLRIAPVDSQRQRPLCQR